MTEKVALPPGIEILRRLGNGGMGVVYLAVDHRRHQTVAVKVIGGRGATDPVARGRFAREIEAVSTIRHPNVVRLLDVGEHEGRPYAIFEHLHGVSLSRLGSLTLPAIVGIAAQAAHAIAATHAAGWVHRDIKASNLMVDSRGTVTLIDFGVAARIEEVDRAVAGAAPPFDVPLTTTGTVVGTRRYLPPEVLRGHRATSSADIYSLGLVVRELLLERVDSDEPIPPPLLDLMQRCTAASPGRRPSAVAIAAALERLPHGHGFTIERGTDSEPTWPLVADLNATAL